MVGDMSRPGFDGGSKKPKSALKNGGNGKEGAGKSVSFSAESMSSVGLSVVQGSFLVMGLSGLIT
jgi:hypothetical protein